MRRLAAMLMVFGLVACVSEGAGVKESDPENSSPTTSLLTTASAADVTTTSAVATTSTTVVPMPETVVEEVVSRWVVDTESRWGDALLIDSGPNLHSPPGLFVFGDGRVRVVYARGGFDGGPGVDQTAIRMATCLDASCDQVEIVELIESLEPAKMWVGGEEGGSRGLWVGFEGDGTPVLVWNADVVEPDFRTLGELVMCSDADCTQVTRTPILTTPTAEEEPRTAQAAYTLTRNPSGQVVFSYEYWPVDSEPELRFAVCGDVRCALPEAGTTVVQGAGVPGDHAAAFLDAGVPVFTGVGVDLEQLLVACDEPRCSGAIEAFALPGPASVLWPSSLAVGPDDAIYIAIEGGIGSDTTGVSLTRCGDTAFEDAVATTVHELPPRTWAPFDMTVNNQGMPSFVWTTASGFEHAVCTGETCQEVTVTATGIPAKALNIETAPDGHSVVAGINPDGVYIVQIDRT